jgi:CubicO group peptidase (beta-lactamase class C family)
MIFKNNPESHFMSQKPFIILCLFIGFAVSSCRNSTQQYATSTEFDYEATLESVGFSSERLARLDSFLIDYVKKGIMPNAITFVARHGKVVHYKAYGWKNIEKKEPLEQNSIFRIASQTKALTSVGLMMLYEKSKFLLNDPVSKYIPEFKNPQVLVKINKSDSSYSSRPARREITIRDLLSHTSGIPYGNEVYEKAGIPGVNSLKPLTIGNVVKKIAKLPLNHDPGEAFTYGLNTDVLGYLIEVLSGEPLDEYFRKELFEPLEMRDSYFYLPADKASRLVTLYENDSLGGSLKACKNVANQTYPVAGAKTYFSGGAGVVGSIKDYANFCKMILNGGSFNGKQLLRRKTIELMSTNQIGDFEVWQNKNKFGLGFEISTEKSHYLMPGSVGTLGWGGLYSTDYRIDPSEDLIMLIYTNANPFLNPDINNRFKILVYQALTGK